MVTQGGADDVSVGCGDHQCLMAAAVNLAAVSGDLAGDSIDCSRSLPPQMDFVADEQQRKLSTYPLGCLKQSLICSCGGNNRCRRCAHHQRLR